MNKNIKSWTSLFYVITYVNSLSFVLLFIINNLVYLCSSAPSNPVQVLLNNQWTNTYESQTSSPLLLLTDNSNLLNSKNEQNFIRNITNIASNKSNSESNLNRNENQTIPLNMQWKRFMWKEVDETMDNIAQSVASSAKMMKNMIDSVMDTGPGLIRYKKAATYYPPPVTSTTNVKYVLKSPLKRNKFVKLSTGPKKIIKIITPSSRTPHFEALTKVLPSISDPKSLNSPSTNSNQFKFLDEEALRNIEKKTEEKVEATISGISPNYENDEILTGKFKNSDEDWRPVTKSEFGTDIYSSTPAPLEESSDFEKKSKPMSQLHTKVSDLPIQRLTGHSYEVTENSAEETIEEPHTFKPQKYAAYNNRNYKGVVTATTSTESPNYSNYFILHTSNSTAAYATNDIKLPKRRHQAENVSSSYSFISRTPPKIDSKNPRETTTTTMKSIFSSTITHEPAISATLKKKIRHLENIGGHRNIKDSQTEENRNHPLKISSQKQDNESDENNKQDRITRNRGTKRFGDRLR